MIVFIPIVGHPEKGGDAECQLEVSADVVVIERFVEPVTVPEHDATHPVMLIFNIVDSKSTKSQLAWFFALLYLFIALILLAIASVKTICLATT